MDISEMNQEQGERIDKEATWIKWRTTSPLYRLTDHVWENIIKYTL